MAASLPPGAHPQGAAPPMSQAPPPQAQQQYVGAPQGQYAPPPGAQAPPPGAAVPQQDDPQQLICFDWVVAAWINYANVTVV